MTSVVSWLCCRWKMVVDDLLVGGADDGTPLNIWVYVVVVKYVVE